jgi:hypothetical protein
MKDREAIVTLARPGATRLRNLARFTTVRQAERYIEKREVRDPVGVHRGDYGIDASTRANAEYQRLKRS